MSTPVERAAAREARKEANRLAWAKNPVNANAERERARAAAIAILADVPDTVESGSLARLRAIMSDQNRPLYQRLEAAEVVVSYEVAPASLVNAPAEQVAAGSFQFMRAVADASDTPEPLRFRALKCLASIENARASRTDPDTAVEARLRLISTINSHRRMALAQHDAWPPPAGVRWALAAEDDVDLALSAPSPARQPSLSIAETLDRARALDPIERQRQADERHRLMLMVEARNRDDTSWRQLLEPDSKSG